MKPVFALESKERLADEMTTIQPNENASLKGPEDWEAWNTQFTSKAISTDIWRLISPKEGREETCYGTAAPSGPPDGLRPFRVVT